MEHAVSVIVPCWNYGRFLRECVESVVRQSRRPSEVLIMDDCSDDHTETVGRQLADENRSVRYFRIMGRVGPTANQNAALGMASGEYAMVLDADDYLDLQYIEKTAAVLDKNPNIGIVYTDAWAFGPCAEERCGSGWYRGIRQGDKFRWEYPAFLDWNTVHQVLKGGNFIVSSALYRRVIYESGARYCDIDTWNDWHLWESAVNRGWMVQHIAEPLFYYRQHSHQQRTMVGGRI